MRTAMMCHKKFAVAVIYAVIKSDMVIIIIAMKSKIKLVEEEPISVPQHSVLLFLSFRSFRSPLC